jgi:hypothetical protein
MLIPSNSDDRLPLPPSRFGQVLLIVISWFIQHVSVDFHRFPSAVQVPGCEFNFEYPTLGVSLSPAMLTSLAPLPIVFAWSTDYVSWQMRQVIVKVCIPVWSSLTLPFGLANIWAEILRKVRNLSRRSTVQAIELSRGKDDT